VEVEGASTEQVATALVNRGASKAMQGDTDGAIADSLRAASHRDADKQLRTNALSLAFAAASQEEADAPLQRVSLAASEALGHFEPAERSEQMEAVLLKLASSAMKSRWPRVLSTLSKNQPPEVVERLEFFRPVAEILETGDRSRLDPLPPEQRAFVEEVLEKFEADEAQQE